MKLLLLAAAAGLATASRSPCSNGAGYRSNLRFRCWQHGSLRLCGGTSTSGRIEIYNRNRWGSICDDIYSSSWVRNFGVVACRQMGFSGPDTRVGYSWYGSRYGVFFNAGQSSHCGGTNGPIWMDDLRCNGNEASIPQCPFGPRRRRTWGSHNCRHYEDVAVACVGSAGPALR
jgi:hypothetical protein